MTVSLADIAYTPRDRLTIDAAAELIEVTPADLRDAIARGEVAHRVVDGTIVLSRATILSASATGRRW